MTDLEATRLCAEALGWTFFRSKHGHWVVTEPDGKRHDPVCPGWPKFDPDTGEKQREPTEDDALRECDYDPLHDDAQLLSLARKFPYEFETSVREWCNHLRRNESYDLNYDFVYRVARKSGEKNGV